MRRTKILATIGPKSSDIEIIKKLMEAGINGVRLNFSHGTYEGHSDLISKVKQARQELGVPIPLILDTRGPEIRIKLFKESKVLLEKGDIFTLTTRDIEGDKTIVSVTYSQLPQDLKRNDRVLLDDGLVELHVNNIYDTDIECSVVNGGYLSSNKGINVPDVYVHLPSVTEKDIEDIKFGIQNGFDYIAASFVRTASDVLAIRNVLEENGGKEIEVIAKIENRDGVNNIDEILELANGIMVARGDLGVEIPPAEVPLVQKELIRKANKKGKPVITATQMLESMVSNPRPTRAEANDVANAIFDGSDTIMLSGETANGDYPIEAVMMMSKIAETAESAVDYKRSLYNVGYHAHSTTTNAISFSACATAADLDAACISTVTYSGFTARMLSKYRPWCPIVACTTKTSVWRKLNLVWGCVPTYNQELPSDGEVFKLAVQQAVNANVAKDGDTVVVCAGLPLGISGATNTIKVELVGEVLIKGSGLGSKVTSGRACVVKVLPEAEKYFRTGDILVVSEVTLELMPYIRNAAALVVGNPETTNFEGAEIASSALGIPLVSCSERAVDVIQHEMIITVDPMSGSVYNGIMGRL